MATINEHFLNLKESYLFTEIANRVAEYTEQHPEKKMIRLGIGDVTLPLTSAVVSSLHKAVDDMAAPETFHGYGPEQGYLFVRQAIVRHYLKFGVSLKEDELFISDGAKSDIGNITDLFGSNNTVLIPDPVYPVYVDTNIMDGRNIVYLNATEENNFLPMPPNDSSADLIYLCSPNNPTGATYNKEQLKKWVDYAIENRSVILFDSAYEAYIADPALPHSIYEIPGAERCAIEFCSLSKTAGFTGTRMGFTVVPHALQLPTSSGQEVELNRLWLRRQSTKFNGVSYIIQKGGEAVFSEEGQKQVTELVAYYMKNAACIASTLRGTGIPFWGGVNSPYLWLKCPNGMNSWDFFDFLLKEANIVGTPGAGFGKNGEHYFRLTSFGNHENTQEAMERLKKHLS